MVPGIVERMIICLGGVRKRKKPYLAIEAIRAGGFGLEVEGMTAAISMMNSGSPRPVRILVVYEATSSRPGRRSPNMNAVIGPKIPLALKYGSAAEANLSLEQRRT